MAHIVLVPFHITSVLNPMLALAHRLTARGHQVTLMGRSDLEDMITAQGLPFVAGKDRPPERSSVPVTAGNLLTRIRTRSARLQAAIAALGMDDFPGLVEQLSPDLFVIDVENHDFVMAASATGIPVILTTIFVSLFKRRGIPPLHRSNIPGVGWKGHPIYIETLWLRFRARKRLRRRIRWLKAAGVDKYAMLQHFADQVGFPFQKEVDPRQWLIPFSYRTVPIMSLNAQEFDFPGKPHSDMHFVGPIIADARREVFPMRSVENKSALTAILKQHTFEKNSRKLVYIAFGSYAKVDEKDFWREIIAAVSEHPDWDVIIGLGGRIKPDALGELPAHVRAYSWVPQLEVLGLADCAVIHGGISTINECIHSGIPMVVYPYNVNDQHGNAARVAYHKLGVLGDRYNDTASAIRRQIERVLEDDRYRDRVRDMQENLRRYVRENTAVNHVESMLRQS